MPDGPAQKGYIMKVSIVKQNGEHLIEIGGRLYPPLSFKSFRPNPRNISEFYEAGVRLFSVLSSGIISDLACPIRASASRGSATASMTSRRSTVSSICSSKTRPKPISRRCSSSTHAAGILKSTACRIRLLTFRRSPAMRTTAAPPPTTCAPWSSTARRSTETDIRLLPARRHDDRMVLRLRLRGAKPIKEAAYRRYMGDDSIRLPSRERLERSGGNFLEASEQDVYDARRFHAELISDLILYFAHELKRRSIIRISRTLFRVPVRAWFAAAAQRRTPRLRAGVPVARYRHDIESVVLRLPLADRPERIYGHAENAVGA